MNVETRDEGESLDFWARCVRPWKITKLSRWQIYNPHSAYCDFGGVHLILRKETLVALLLFDEVCDYVMQKPVKWSSDKRQVPRPFCVGGENCRWRHRIWDPETMLHVPKKAYVPAKRVRQRDFKQDEIPRNNTGVTFCCTKKASITIRAWRRWPNGLNKISFENTYIKNIMECRKWIRFLKWRYFK